MDPVLARSLASLAQAVHDARDRTFDLVADLSDEQLIGPRLATVNPLLWEIGHLAWFQEWWVMRNGGRLPPSFPEVDRLYDSMKVPHDTRWDLALLPRARTLAYLTDVRDRTIARLTAGARSRDDVYFVLLSVFHEDMHDEAFTYTRQTLGYPSPRLGNAPFGDAAPTDDSRLPAGARSSVGPYPSDATVPGGEFPLGAGHEEPFVFDNEKWSHLVTVPPFSIARAPVTQADYAEFVETAGYRSRDLWTEPGWLWRIAAGAEHPVHWRRGEGGWERRDFDRWVPLEPARPVVHVNAHEAEAFCRFAGRRLPTEAEWEMAASLDPATGEKRRYPWGDEPPSPARANMDWRAMGCLDVGALSAGDAASGCRQMLGNVWEWTATSFGPYPGFVPDPYADYSKPWFDTHRVLRGGCWATRSRLIRNTWRNFYEPHRRDVIAGFRTCALP